MCYGLCVMPYVLCVMCYVLCLCVVLGVLLIASFVCSYPVVLELAWGGQLAALFHLCSHSSQTCCCYVTVCYVRSVCYCSFGSFRVFSVRFVVFRGR